MSAEHVAWVFRHSPAKGAAFQIHLAVADSCNDANDHRFWMKLTRLAEKARVSRGAAQKAMGWLMESGYLELLSDEDRRRAGRPAEYRFLFPDVDVVFETRRRTSRTEREVSETSRQEREDLASTSRGTSRLRREDLASRARGIRTQGKTQGEEPKEDARAEASDARVDWQVPDVVARAGCLEAALELCAHWAERLEARGVNVGARARSKAWVAPMEAMLRIDQREPAHVRRVIDWLEDGRDDVASFWRANVLSPDKLRTRWDQMGQQYQRERNRPGRDPQGLSSLVAEIQRREAAGE